MAAIEADRGLEFSAHTLPPTSLGTALPFELVTECLRALDAEYSRWNAPMRLATMRAISLCSKAWHPLGQCFLYSQVGVSLRPSGVTTTPTIHAPPTHPGARDVNHVLPYTHELRDLYVTTPDPDGIRLARPPSLSWFLCLRTLIILQPYRGSKHAQRSRRLEGDKIAAYVAAVLGSARRLPLLTFIAPRSPDQLGNASWPDMRRSSAQIFGLLPYSLVSLGLSTAATSLDLRHVDDLLSDKATRMLALARISMNKTAKALVPRPDDEYERRAAAKDVRIIWTSSAILSDT